MPTIRERIVSAAVRILKDVPEGIRFTEMVQKITEALPDIGLNTVKMYVSHLDRDSKDVYKPERGLFRHASFRESEVSTAVVEEVGEEDFYEPFADYLVSELEECTSAIPLGGNIFKDKWGTPDVIGVNKSRDIDIVKHETEIVSAEVKTSTSDLIKAFGQACAYKAFSHKVYLLIPRDASEEDKSRIGSLCLIFGIGLILFNRTDKEKPQFEIRVNALRHEPDMFYVNDYIKKLEPEHLKGLNL